jgi:coenzyme F420-0:L-glutamate ligase / coenzyme F420-1:gamma-L-glutamate ligase
MAAARVTLIALPGIPLIQPGDDLASALIDGIRAAGHTPCNRDVLVVTQKIVSKAEGRYLRLDEVTVSPRAKEIARQSNKDPRLVEVILTESAEVIRCQRDVLIVEHRLGFVMANAGVDQSNIDHPDGAERVLLLPADPDGTCLNLKRRLDGYFGADLGVIINDSFGRAWRNGVVGIALGAAGLPSLVDMVGDADLFGRKLRVTQIAFADEIAAAASLVMGQAAERQPAVLVHGLDWGSRMESSVRTLIRPKDLDLFR